jgi:hypothetical protein
MKSGSLEHVAENDSSEIKNLRMILHKFARIMSKQRFSVEESKNTPRWPTFKKKYPLTRPFPLPKTFAQRLYKGL